MIEENDVFTNHPLSMAFVEKQDMAQAFAPNTAQEPFTKGIRSRSLEGCVEQFDLRTSDGPFKQQSILVVIVTIRKVDGSSQGNLGASFKIDALKALGQTGTTFSFGANGTLSIMMSADGSGYAAWNGGSLGANGQGDFAKSFTCN